MYYYMPFRTLIRHFPVLILVFLPILFTWLESRMVMPHSAVILEDGNLSDVQQSRLDLTLDLTKLFLGFAVAVIGGTGLLLTSAMKKNILYLSWL